MAIRRFQPSKLPRTMFYLSLLTLSVVLAMSGTPLIRAEEGLKVVSKAGPPKIQIALLLDTSSSMEGLIDQAKAELWKIVGQYSKATREGQRPQVEVALYEYGHSRLPAAQGYIRQCVPLTDNLDKISEELFRLTIMGGDEYCGQVIQCAVRDLKWDQARGTLKCVFIAGNEPFTQGPVDYQVACREAAGRDITINTIHCGSAEEGARTGWMAGAKLADGAYMAIDHNQKVVPIDAPQDKQLAQLSAELNTTYVPYGTAQAREENVQRQTVQDNNAASIHVGNAAQRAAIKADSHCYGNSSWDLVDACNNSKVKVAELKDEQLPEELRKLSVAKREEYVAAKNTQRKQIQEQIKKLSAERDQHIAAAQKNVAEKTSSTLDEAIIGAVRTQAERKSFVFEK